MFLLIAFVKIIDGYIYNEEIQALIEFPFLPVCLFKLEIILVEGGKNCPHVACWLLIELTFCFHVSFLMVLLMKLIGFNFIEQKSQT